MIEVTIKTRISDSFIIKMLSMMIDGRMDNLPSKQEFINYLKIQIMLYGTDEESQFGEDQTRLYGCHYERATELFKKWKLDRRIRL